MSFIDYQQIIEAFESQRFYPTVGVSNGLDNDFIKVWKLVRFLLFSQGDMGGVKFLQGTRFGVTISVIEARQG